MHAHPEVGKNRLDSFLALPMQRLTRLKLLVEVIHKLQSVVASDAEERAIAGSTETMTPGACENIRRMKITKEQLENSSIALRELKRVGRSNFFLPMAYNISIPFPINAIIYINGLKKNWWEFHHSIYYRGMDRNRNIPDIRGDRLFGVLVSYVRPRSKIDRKGYKIINLLICNYFHQVMSKFMSWDFFYRGISIKWPLVLISQLGIIHFNNLCDYGSRSCMKI